MDEKQFNFKNEIDGLAIKQFLEENDNFRDLSERVHSAYEFFSNSSRKKPGILGNLPLVPGYEKERLETLTSILNVLVEIKLHQLEDRKILEKEMAKRKKERCSDRIFTVVITIFGCVFCAFIASVIFSLFGRQFTEFLINLF